MSSEAAKVYTLDEHKSIENVKKKRYWCINCLAPLNLSGCEEFFTKKRVKCKVCTAALANFYSKSAKGIFLVVSELESVNFCKKCKGVVGDKGLHKCED